MKIHKNLSSAVKMLLSVSLKWQGLQVLSEKARPASNHDGVAEEMRQKESERCPPSSKPSALKMSLSMLTMIAHTKGPGH